MKSDEEKLREWRSLSDEEKAKRVGQREEINITRGQAAELMTSQISAIVLQMMRDGGPARAAFDAIMARGVSKEEAFDTIGRAVYCCMHETSRGLADRWPEIVAALAEGRTVEELFPNELYLPPKGQGH
jgi:hypothetical protein